VTQDNVIKPAQPGTFSDPLTEVLRNGARALLAQAVEAEVATFLGDHDAKLTVDGNQRLVRHGHLPERERFAARRSSASPRVSPSVIASRRRDHSAGVASHNSRVPAEVLLLRGRRFYFDGV
jgi:uncharacterized caspase-like protein